MTDHTGPHHCERVEVQKSIKCRCSNNLQFSELMYTSFCSTSSPPIRFFDYVRTRAYKVVLKILQCWFPHNNREQFKIKPLFLSFAGQPHGTPAKHAIWPMANQQLIPIGNSFDWLAQYAATFCANHHKGLERLVVPENSDPNCERSNAFCVIMRLLICIFLYGIVRFTRASSFSFVNNMFLPLN